MTAESQMKAFDEWMYTQSKTRFQELMEIAFPKATTQEKSKLYQDALESGYLTQA